MARNANTWMEFKGQNCAQLGVRLIRSPDRPRAAMRGEAVEVPGRHGKLWLASEGYEAIQLAVDMRTQPGADRQRISEWLTGSGALRFSGAPDYAYRARAMDPFSYSRFAAGMDDFSVTFDCDPFLYAANPAMISLASGGLVENPGTVAADPVITMYGSGDMALMVGANTLLIHGVSGSVVIDCEAKLAYAPGAGSTLLTGSLSGDWPQLVVGYSMVNWTGATRVEIRPNWRWL